MKYVWEADDIEGGRWADNPSPAKFMVSIVSLQGGYPFGAHYGISHIGSDGVTMHMGTPEQVADFLNQNGYVPCDKITTTYNKEGKACPIQLNPKTWDSGKISPSS